MTEEKLNIDFVPAEEVEFKFAGHKIAVSPFFSFKDKLLFITEYVNYLFTESEEDISIRYLVAEHGLMMDIINRCTNIDVEQVDFDNLVASGFWNQVKARIADYEDFRKELNSAVEIKRYEKQLEKSVGAIVENIADKLTIALQKISESDVESLKKTTEEFSKKLEELNNTVPGILGKPARGRKKKEN